MRKVFVLALAALTLGTEALAGDMTYSYVQADVQGGELDGGFGTISGAGFGLHGSVGIGPVVHIFGDYGNTKYAGNGLKARLLPRGLGVGAHLSLSPSIDVFGGASLEHLTIKTGQVGFGGFTQSDGFKGWGVALGVRGWIGENFQWTGIVKHRDLRDLQKINSITMNGYYYFRRAWAVGMEYTYQKYDNQIMWAKDSVGSLNVRYSFNGLK